MTVMTLIPCHPGADDLVGDGVDQDCDGIDASDLSIDLLTFNTDAPRTNDVLVAPAVISSNDSVEIT